MNQDPLIVDFYRSLISFFEIFTKDNPNNQDEMLIYFDNILILAELYQGSALDINYRPIKVTRLLGQILAEKK
jgi:hypothetical protein